VLAALACQVADDSFRLRYWLVFLFAWASVSKPLQLFDVLVPSSLHMSIVAEQEGSPQKKKANATTGSATVVIFSASWSVMSGVQRVGWEIMLGVGTQARPSTVRGRFRLSRAAMVP
jgi:hypothetical protein